MANSCSTDYQVVGLQLNVENFYNKLRSVLSTDRSYQQNNQTFKENASWLGYVVSDILDVNPENESISCRGTIVWLDEQINISDDGTSTFQLMTETAWTDCRKLFYLLSKHFNVDIFFMSEELGCDFLESNDNEQKYFSTQFIINDLDNDMEYYSSFEELRDEIKKLTGDTPSNFQEVEKIIENHDDTCENINVYQVSYVTLQDF